MLLQQYTRSRPARAAHSPQSSSSWGASASVGGVRDTTSRSAPHSGHGKISPGTASITGTSAAHSGHSATPGPPLSRVAPHLHYHAITHGVYSSITKKEAGALCMGYSRIGSVIVVRQDWRSGGPIY